MNSQDSNLQMRSVYSSHVNQIGHDPKTNELVVIWDTGKRSVYSNVPAPLAARVMNSPSIGSALHADIKPNFPHRYA